MPGKAYSQEDEEYLERAVGVVPMRKIARKLGRTEGAIKSKLWRMEMPHSTSHGFLSANECARIYNSSPKHIITLIEKGHLKARQQSAGRRMFLIEPSEAEKVAPLLRDIRMFQRGQHHSRTVLNEEKVREIHRLKGKVPYSQLAEMFGVSKSVIAQVAQGRSWKHLAPKKWYERDRTGRS